MNVSTWSLLDPKPCDFEKPQIRKEKRTIQLLETLRVQDISVTQCKIKIKRWVRRCSLLGYLEPVENGMQEYLLDVSPADCKRIHESKSFLYDATHIIYNLKINDTVDRSIYLAGNAVDNSCNTGSFADQFGSYSKVNVEAIVSVSLHEYSAKVNIEQNKIMLRSGVVCEFDRLQCIDSEGGYTFWSPIKSESCIENKFSILYEGIVDKIFSKHNNYSETFYSIDSEGALFSLAEKDHYEDCGEMLVRTEEPGFFVRILNNNVHNRYRQSSYKEVNLFSYINVKYIYIERHFREQIEQLHQSILLKRCESRTAELRQVLNSFNTPPDIFALNLMKRTGFIAHKAGEVVHVVQCLPAEVQVAEDLDECYDQLPVYQNGQLKFLTPKTRVIISRGTQMPCNSLLPNYFYVNGKWITADPGAKKAEISPKQLSPEVADTFIATRIRYIATAGIYTLQEIQDFAQRLLFPIERQALLNDVARAMNNEPTKNQEVLANLITESLIISVAKKSWNLIWTDFMVFGQFSSGIMAIVYCAQAVVALIELTIRGYILHQIFGFSCKLLGAVLNSLTHLMIIRKQRENKRIPDEPIILRRIQKSHIPVFQYYPERVHAGGKFIKKVRRSFKRDQCGPIRITESSL